MRTLWGSEQRAISYQDVWGSGGTWAPVRANADVNVNVDSALGLSAVLRCVRLLSDTVSTLPLQAFRESGDQRTRLNPPPQLVSDPSAVVSREEWLQQAMVSLLLWGNAYGLVTTRDRLQVPTTVDWLSPDSVEVKQTSALRPPSYDIDGERVDADDIIHIRAFLKPGSVTGVPPLTMQRETLGLGIAAQKYGAQWFGDGAHPSAILSSDSPVTQEQAKTIKDRFVASLKGKREPAVLGAGMKYQAVQVAANESQFLETHQAVVNDVARAFGVPAEMIGGGGNGSSLTYANREQSAIDFLTFSVNPWLIRIERAISDRLVRGQFVKFNPDALLRTDTKTRYDAHSVALSGHFLTIDEVRALEDRPPLDIGEMFPPNKVTGQQPGDQDDSDQEVDE